MSRFICAMCCLLLTLACFSQSNSASEANKKIASVKSAYAKTKRAYERTPKDVKVRTAHIAATTKLADTYMTVLGLAPKDKYPNALKYYREVIKLDPKNRHAIESANLIVSIYKSLNRPVPKT